MSDEEWNDNRGRGGREGNSNPNDVSNALKNQVDVGDDGKLKIFGKEFDVGKNGALVVRPLVDLAISQLSVRGAATATRFGTKLSNVVMPKHWAAKVGKGLGFVWLFGLSASDVALGIKKTVNDGFKDMHELRDKWAPLLAANHNMDTSVSKALSSNFGVIAHSRARVYENGKRELLATIAGGIRAIPTILMGIYQYQADNIAHPERVRQARTHKNMTAQERTGLEEDIQKLTRQKMTGKQRERMDNSHDDLVSTVSRLFTEKGMRRMRAPKNEYEYRKNVKSLTIMPPIFGVVSELIERHITKKTKDTDEDAGDKILNLQAFIHNHDEPDRENVVIQVREIFQQRAKDLGRKYTLEGDTFNRTCEAIADAVLTGLHPQAIVEILDNRKAVTFGKNEAEFGDSEEIKIALEALKQKYTKKVSEKKFYKDSPFTRETLAKTFNEMPVKDRPYLAMVVPRSIMIKLPGVNRTEVKQAYKEAHEIMQRELISMTKSLMEVDVETLKKSGVKSQAISEFEAFKETWRRAENNDHGNAFIGKDPEKAARVIRDVMLSAKNPKELWQEYLKKRGEETVASIPAEERKGVSHLTDENKGEGSSLPAK